MSEEETWTPPYNDWILRKLEHHNSIRHYEPKEWDDWHGMRVKDLVAALITYSPNMPVCIRAGIGWSGVDNYEIETKHVVIKASGESDYSQCRDAIRAGTIPHIEALALTKSDYSSDSEHIDAYDFEIEEE